MSRDTLPFSFRQEFPIKSLFEKLLMHWIKSLLFSCVVTMQTDLIWVHCWDRNTWISKSRKPPCRSPLGQTANPSEKLWYHSYMQWQAHVFFFPSKCWMFSSTCLGFSKKCLHLFRLSAQDSSAKQSCPHCAVVTYFYFFCNSMYDGNTSRAPPHLVVAPKGYTLGTPTRLSVNRRDTMYTNVPHDWCALRHISQWPTHARSIARTTCAQGVDKIALCSVCS